MSHKRGAQEFIVKATGESVSAIQLEDWDDSARRVLLWGEGRIGRWPDVAGQRGICILPITSYERPWTIQLTNWVYRYDNSTTVFVIEAAAFEFSFERVDHQVLIWD